MQEREGEGGDLTFIEPTPIVGTFVEAEDNTVPFKGTGNVPSGISGTTTEFLSKRGFGWLLELDEEEGESSQSLLEELEIDPTEILKKVRCVLIPFRIDRSVILSSPDFWGPLAVVMCYALLLLWGQLHVVSWILTVWLFGSFFIFLLARLLGGEVTYSQSLGVIGYSLIPLDIIALFLMLSDGVYLTFFLKVFGTVWASFSAGSLLINTEKLSQKRVMLFYPVLLLYIYFMSLYNGV